MCQDSVVWYVSACYCSKCLINWSFGQHLSLLCILKQFWFKVYAAHITVDSLLALIFYFHKLFFLFFLFPPICEIYLFLKKKKHIVWLLSFFIFYRKTAIWQSNSFTFKGTADVKGYLKYFHFISVSFADFMPLIFTMTTSLCVFS